MYKQNSKLVLIQKSHAKVYGVFSASLRYIEQKSAIRAQQNLEGGYRYYRLVSRYTFFWQKYDVSIQKRQIKVYRVFPAILRYIERKSTIEGPTKRRGGYRYTVYRHRIPFSGKKCNVAFHFDLFFDDVCVFL